MTTTTRIETNCDVLIEWRVDGVAGSRKTDLEEVAPWALPGWNPETGEPYRGHNTSLTFETPSGEWIWADGRLWLPRSLGCRASHWISLETLAEVVDVIKQSLAGRTPEEIYDAA